MFDYGFLVQIEFLTLRLKAEAEGRAPTGEQYGEVLKKTYKAWSEAEVARILALAQVAKMESKPRGLFDWLLG